MSGRAETGLLKPKVRTSRLLRLVFGVLDRFYLLGLDRLVGRRFLRITHCGRKSGRRYHTLLEVVAYDPVARESVVLSGWGGRSDWYRNITAAPALEIQTAGHSYVPDQRLVDGDELYWQMQRYLERNPLMRGLVRRVLGVRLDGSLADRASFMSHEYRGVAFRPDWSGKRNNRLE